MVISSGWKIDLLFIQYQIGWRAFYSVFDTIHIIYLFFGAFFHGGDLGQKGVPSQASGFDFGQNHITALDFRIEYFL